MLVLRQTKPHFNGIIKGSFSTDLNDKVQVQTARPITEWWITRFSQVRLPRWRFRQILLITTSKYLQIITNQLTKISKRRFYWLMSSLVHSFWLSTLSTTSSYRIIDSLARVQVRWRMRHKYLPRGNRLACWALIKISFSSHPQCCRQTFCQR